jgi:hypothetical protein
MVDLIGSYELDTRSAAVEAARRHAGVSGPAWLLPVAITHQDPAEALAEARQLAVEADAPPEDIEHWAAYVALAIDARRGALPEIPAPSFCGVAAADALGGARWVLGTRPGFGRLVAHLSSLQATPSAAAAATGLWGLAHGAAAIPRTYRCRLRRSMGPLADSLLRARYAGPGPTSSVLDDLLSVA